MVMHFDERSIELLSGLITQQRVTMDIIVDF